MSASIDIGRQIARVEGPRSDGSYLFTITYGVHFSNDELGRRFDDAVKIWESDSDHPPPSPFDPAGDDPISAYTPPETFTASANAVLRTKQITLTRDQLSTEIGTEEVYAWIWVRRTGSTGPADDEQHTQTGVAMPVIDE